VPSTVPAFFTLYCDYYIYYDAPLLNCYVLAPATPGTNVALPYDGGTFTGTLAATTVPAPTLPLIPPPGHGAHTCLNRHDPALCMTILLMRGVMAFWLYLPAASSSPPLRRCCYPTTDRYSARRVKHALGPHCTAMTAAAGSARRRQRRAGRADYTRATLHSCGAGERACLTLGMTSRQTTRSV